MKPGVIIIEGHVQGLSNTRSLGAAGIPVIVVDKGDCVARYSRYCTVFFRCPDYDTDALADFLIRLAEARNLKDWLLFPSNDHAVLTLSRNKARLEAYFKIITPGLNIIENIYDKSRLLTLAQTIGVPIPDTFYAQDAAPADVPPVFPVLTRGRFGLDFYKATGRKAFLAHDKAELHQQLALIARTFPVQKTLTQYLIPDDGTNKTISFAAFCVAGEIKAYWMGEKLREHPVRFGTATFAKSMYAEPCLTQSKKLLKALDYTGVCEVEYLKDPRDGQYKLIEINARTWLWVGLAVACGINFPLYIYNHVHNIKTTYPATYEKNLYWRNFWTDMIYSMKYMIQGHLRYSDYRKSLRSKMVYAVRSKSDPTPFQKMLILLFLRWRSQ
ncbi:MAG: hypothetical protein RBR67_16385 [Desulfobacterium sp.]|nr:hypothetical protein [Desulfobacterium sp.]